jgi:hypothetical protein
MRISVRLHMGGWRRRHGRRRHSISRVEEMEVVAWIPKELGRARELRYSTWAEMPVRDWKGIISGHTDTLFFCAEFMLKLSMLWVYQ